MISKRAEIAINRIVDVITNIGKWIIVTSVILMLTLFSMLGFLMALVTMTLIWPYGAKNITLT